MKFLIDRCVGRRLAEWLSSDGHDSVYSTALGPDPGDLALLQRAVSEKRILVTIDTDFGRLVYRGGEVHCGIVRLPDVRVNRRVQLMRIVIERYGPQLEKGAIVTVRGEKIRVSVP
jgi:predicted nuclease of predicted toxin-antitoxin system